MRISIIVAIARNNAIGLRNQLLYWLPNDLKRFKQLTTGNTIIMGKNTFDSLPKGALPNRRNVVLSRTATAADCPGADVFPSLTEALLNCQQHELQGDPMAHEIYIIGGAAVYRQTAHLADRLCLTCVDNIPAETDTFFPEIDPKQWRETFREHHDADERHAFAYDFVNLERIR